MTKTAISHALHVAVLYRVEVNVIHVTSEIVLVADRVLPEAALPDAASPLRERLAETRSVGRSPRENAALMSCQRVAKSLSPEGKVHNA